MQTIRKPAKNSQQCKPEAQPAEALALDRYYPLYSQRPLPDHSAPRVWNFANSRSADLREILPWLAKVVQTCHATTSNHSRQVCAPLA